MLGEHRDRLRVPVAALKAFAEQLWALHSNDYDYGAQSGGGVAEKSAKDRKHHDEVFKSTIYQT